MNLILHPALLYAALALGLVGCLALFFALKLEIRRLEAHAAKREQAQARVWTARLEILERKQGELEETAQFMAPPGPPASGFNLTRRSQAIQMFRRGETPEQIARTLGVPRNEVDLLLKVHGIVLAAYNS